MFELLSFGDAGWGDEISRGLVTTLILAVICFVTGTFVGLMLTLLRRAGRFSRFVVGAYVTVLRGVPELLVIYLFFFGTGVFVRGVAASFGYTEYINLSGFFLAALALTCITAAYSAEVFRGAASSIPPGQAEAARAFGFKPSKAFRLIELPQLIVVALPGLGNIWLILLKDTALVSLTSVAELMRQSTVAAGATFRPFTFYAIAAAIYFIISMFSERAVTAVERRIAITGER
ncbi:MULTISPECIES: ABC transporter permease [unclassified Pseudophaeobacter]|uniref:ABC transporter permease n=1 Tax=unclassified Pseudophaeobacter TaxID=2637024 RepID=UPI000EFA6F76|nr:ABC transporter permease subunit [Pseudophaeobacter sp. EL27]